jgi:hypothetical protein
VNVRFAIGPIAIELADGQTLGSPERRTPKIRAGHKGQTQIALPDATQRRANRVEMHLVSLVRQKVRVCGKAIEFPPTNEAKGPGAFCNCPDGQPPEYVSCRPFVTRLALSHL